MINKISAQLEALSVREFRLVSLALCVLLAVIGFLLLIEPLSQASDTNNRQQQRLAKQQQQLQASSQLLNQALDLQVAETPDLEQLEEQKELRRKQLANALAEGATADKLTTLLPGEQLRLEQLLVLPSKPLQSHSHSLQKHRVELQLSGTQQQLASYLSSLHGNTHGLYWESLVVASDNAGLSLQGDASAKAVLTLYSLGQGNSWQQYQGADL